MDKPNAKSFPKDRCDYFGARIEMKKTPGGPMEKAVIKTFQPCAEKEQQFGIIFDSDPPGKEPRFENLFRQNRKDWKKISWEDDNIFETKDLRPICPNCGHPLGVGRAAWTYCQPCGKNEPGAMSYCLLTRRSKDTHANPAMAEGFYHESDCDSDPDSD